MKRWIAACLLCAAAGAGDERTVAEWHGLEFGEDVLVFRDGILLGEGPRGLQDRFPFMLAGGEEDRKAGRGTMLTPRNLARFLAPDEHGAVIATTQQAFAAVRLFVSGPLVRTDAQARKIMAAARALPAELGVRVHPEPPLGRRGSARTTRDGFRVSFTALEMVGRMRLVAVTADVTRAGAIRIEKTAIVDGPPLTWQSGYQGEPTPAQLAADKRRRRQVDKALLDCAAAAGFEADVDTAWALARVLDRVDQVYRVLGPPDREWGTTAHISYWMLPDNVVVSFGGTRHEDAPELIEYAGLSRRSEQGGGIASYLRAFRRRG